MGTGGSGHREEGVSRRCGSSPTRNLKKRSKLIHLLVDLKHSLVFQKNHVSVKNALACKGQLGRCSMGAFIGLKGCYVDTCRRPLGTDGAGGKSRSMVRSEKEAFRKEVLEAIRVLEEVKFLENQKLLGKQCIFRWFDKTSTFPTLLIMEE